MSIADTFQRQAQFHLPGHLFSLNIADLKRRNCHLSHLVGDQDIAELDGMLRALSEEGCLITRTGGNVWLVVSRRDETKRIEALLERYRRCEALETGWRVEAEKDDEKADSRRTIRSEMRRAVRCLSAPVDGVDALAAAMKAMAANDYSLPVNRVLPLSEVAHMEREPWCCVSTYPLESPSCPFCQGKNFNWKDGDMSVYSGWGNCKGCGAEINITQIS